MYIASKVANVNVKINALLIAISHCLSRTSLFNNVDFNYTTRYHSISIPDSVALVILCVFTSQLLHIFAVFAGGFLSVGKSGVNLESALTSLALICYIIKDNRN